MTEKVRLGGMAMENGVLVHGPTSWGAAVRDPDGTLHVASGRKPRFADRVSTPIVRGPLRLAEAFAVVPVAYRALPQARLPFARPAVLATVGATMVGGKLLRRSSMSRAAREAVAGALALLPAALALREPGLAEYHGAEHVSIGTYEQDGERAPKEHPRCGSMLIGPLLASSLAANVAASAAPRRARGLSRLLGTTAAIGASVEVFAWMNRHPEHRVARALARPGFELQRRFSTAEPSAAQLEVADAARDACLALER